MTDFDRLADETADGRLEPGVIRQAIADLEAERDALAAHVAALRAALDDVRVGCFCSMEYGVDGNDHDSSCKKAVAVLNDTAAAAAAHDERVRADERERCARVVLDEVDGADEERARDSALSRLADRIRATGAEGRTT